jgi:hypothetical protein
MRNEAPLWRAADELLTFLAATGRKNALIEIANEINVVEDLTEYDLFAPDRQAEMIATLGEKHPGFLYSTSGGGVKVKTGCGMPSLALVGAADYTLPTATARVPPSCPQRSRPSGRCLPSRPTPSRS